MCALCDCGLSCVLIFTLLFFTHSSLVLFCVVCACGHMDATAHGFVFRKQCLVDQGDNSTIHDMSPEFNEFLIYRNN